VDVLVAAAEAPLEQLDAKHEAAHVRRHVCTDWRRAPEARTAASPVVWI
tara:strand:+ start:449 stop:595 length:147 start_codon:yes stop_codon:yes gene_type:complete